jgi:tetratricopeptide (TPR) repeat protein
MMGRVDPDRDIVNDFREGMQFFEVGNYDVALEFFTEVANLVGRDDGQYNVYRSWLGLTQAMQGQRGGLVLCRLAAKEEAREGEVFFNLARAEFRIGDVDKALRALEQGHRVSPDHTGIHDMLARLDRRRDPAIPFLSRNNVLNRLIGKLTWRMARRREAKTVLQE